MSVVVITGASAGVGRATAHAFAKKGASLGLMARGQDPLEIACGEVRALGGKALPIVVDVSNSKEVASAADQIEQEFGPIDIWINNAMVSVFSPFQELTPEEFRRVTEVTYLGYVYGTMVALTRMRERGGVIVQVGSALAYRAIPLQSAYCGAKHAVEGFTESVRSELLHDRSPVRITMVQLPAVNTPQFRWVKSRLRGKPQPVPPIFQPEVAANAIVWAAENTPREIIVGGRAATIVWGNKFFPGFGDWYLSRTGYDSQQMKIPDDPNRPFNLWQPVSSAAGVHGDFDDRSYNFSYQLWMRTHWKSLLAIGGVTLAAVSLLRKK
jgi:NAD(P)-dependent dehydrogenase (short-subunit alcohol dehydrogenase family)